MGRWYGAVAIGFALALVAVLLALPSPTRPPTTGPTRPAALAEVWPAAHPFPMPGYLPDGSAYRPQRILDPTTSVGLATSPDGSRTALVVVSGAGVRTLQSERSPLYQGIGATTDRLFWMLTATDAAGHPSVGLWTAPRAGGPATRLSADVGLPLLLGSAYDLSAVGDRLYWTSAYPGTGRTELRSIPLSGGPVRVEPLPGSWAMSAWPWLVSAPDPDDPATRLYNTRTRTMVTVAAPAHQEVSCGPVWCRLVPAGPDTRPELVRPNGSDLRVAGEPGALPVGADVAARDRFEPLLVPAGGAGGIGARLVLYDLATARTVVVAPNVSNAYGDATHLWWSVGDNETLSWYGLDLRTLG